LVEFLDYGNKETVNKEDLRLITNEFALFKNMPPKVNYFLFINFDGVLVLGIYRPQIFIFYSKIKIRKANFW
jgi:hypothetical protein